jgi:hypothetical protein
MQAVKIVHSKGDEVVRLSISQLLLCISAILTITLNTFFNGFLHLVSWQLYVNVINSIFAGLLLVVLLVFGKKKKAAAVFAVAWLISSLPLLAMKMFHPVFPIYKFLLSICVCFGGLAGWFLWVEDSSCNKKWQALPAAAFLILVAFCGGYIPTTDTATGNQSVDVKHGIIQVLPVITAQGDPFSLDLRQKPAILIAPWSDESDKILQRIGSIDADKRPYIVGVYLDQKNLHADMQKLEEKINDFAKGSEVYFMLEPPPFKGTPAFLYVYNNELMAANTASSVNGMLELWDRVLSSGSRATK